MCFMIMISSVFFLLWPLFISTIRQSGLPFYLNEIPTVYFFEHGVKIFVRPPYAKCINLAADSFRNQPALNFAKFAYSYLYKLKYS